MNEIIGKVAATHRRQNSYVGNPAYMVTIETESGEILQARTAPNAMLNYAITNLEYREQLHTFTLDERGRIRRAAPVAGDA